MDSRERFSAKQKLAHPSRYYGDGGTIHADNTLDVELDIRGNVVSVWFRCQLLPFRQIVVDEDRASEMRSVMAGNLTRLTGVEVLDEETP